MRGIKEMLNDDVSDGARQNAVTHSFHLSKQNTGIIDIHTYVYTNTQQDTALLLLLLCITYTICDFINLNY